MLSPEAEFNRAIELFEKGEYEKTIEYLKHFFNRYPGSHYIDDAEFYYAESFYKLGRYNEAMDEFQFLIYNFPNSNWSEKALLRKAQCLEKISPIPQRDQTVTREALDTYERFIEKYPYSKFLDEARQGKNRVEEKLNKKLIEIGETYLKMGIEKAATVYLKRAANQSEKWKDKANLLLGDIALSKNRNSLAASYYSKVEGKFKKEAQEKLKEIK